MLDRRAEAETLLHRAHAAHVAGHYSEAESGYRRTLVLYPDLIAADHLLAVLWLQRGAAARSAERLRSLLRRGHALPAIALVLAQARETMGDGIGAALAFRQTVALDPSETAGWIGLGNEAAQAGDFALTATRLRRALAVDLVEATALGNLGSALAELQEPSAACWQRRALAMTPATKAGWINIGHHSRGTGDWGRARCVYARAMTIDPGDAAAVSETVHATLHIAEWNGLDRLLARLGRTLASGGNAPPFHLLALDLPAELKRANAERWCGRFSGSSPRRARTTAGTRLRLGYLSGDFRRHVVAYHMTDLLEHHDQDRVALHAYTWAADDGSDVRARLRRAFHQWTDVGRLSDAEAAARIAADEIDVLIDLAGHTYGARPGIVARRPSPIQVSYFGFPGTTGAHYHDYAMVDPIVVPKGADVGFTEALARLTGCYFPFDTREPPPGIRPERASLGLPERAVVLACFNQVYKIQPRTFALWMKVLAAAPDAVLWLLDPGPIARENLQRGAENASVRSSRLIFAPPAPRPAHLLRCSAADLAIDTLPYNAHSTAMDVLAVGCPMVAMLGNDFAGRVSASVLHAVGLSDLIAPDERTSLSLMIELATDRTRLASVRDRLVRRLLAGPLFDMNRLCRDIESAVLEMHRRHADGEPARSFDLSSGVNGR